MQTTGKPSFPIVLYLMVAAVVLGYALVDLLWVQRITGFVFNDSWEHTAALRALLENPFDPANPHVASQEPSPRFMPLFVAAAMIGRVFGIGPIGLLEGLTIFNLAMILTGLFLFFRAYFKDPWAPVVGLAVLVGAWGTGFIWSNATALRALPLVAGYPSGFTFGLTLVIWWLVLRTLRSSEGRGLAVGAAVTAVLLWLALQVHVLTALFTVGGLVLLAVLSEAAGWRNRVAVWLAVPLAALAVELWPYYSTLAMFLDRLPEVGVEAGAGEGGVAGSRLSRLLSDHLFYRPFDVVSGLGVALLGLPIAAWFAIRRIHAFVVLGLCGLLLVYLGNLFVTLPLGHRALLFAVFFAHMAITGLVLEWGRAVSVAEGGLLSRLRSRKWSTAAVGVVALGVLGNVLIAAADIRHLDRGRNDPHGLGERADWASIYGRLAEPLDDKSVVFGRAQDTWPLPTFRGKTVALAHSNSLVGDYRERSRDVRRFFARGASDEERSALLRKWGATHLLVRPSDVASAEFGGLIEAQGHPAGRAGPLVLYRLSASHSTRWDG